MDHSSTNIVYLPRLPWVLIAFLIAVTSPVSAECRAGSPLLELVANSDAVAVIEKEREVFSPRRGFLGKSTGQHSFRFVASQVLKLAPIGGASLSGKNRLVTEGRGRIRLLGVRRYLAFLRLHPRGVWMADACHLLEINPQEMVDDACVAISDLFGDRPYQREQRCLLVYPPDARLTQVVDEIEKQRLDAITFEGAGTVVVSPKYLSEWKLQKVLFAPDVRARKRFLGKSFRDKPVEVVLYVPSEKFDLTRFNKVFRVGRRLEIKGFWSRGTFFLEQAN